MMHAITRKRLFITIISACTIKSYSVYYVNIVYGGHVVCFESGTMGKPKKVEYDELVERECH